MLVKQLQWQVSFLLLNLMNQNYFICKNIWKTSLLMIMIMVSDVFWVFYFFKSFYLRFKVVHVHEFMGYVICICLAFIFVTYLHVKCASSFICLYDCIFVYLHDCILYLCLHMCRPATQYGWIFICWNLCLCKRYKRR